MRHGRASAGAFYDGNTRVLNDHTEQLDEILDVLDRIASSLESIDRKLDGFVVTDE